MPGQGGRAGWTFLEDFAINNDDEDGQRGAARVQEESKHFPPAEVPVHIAEEDPRPSGEPTSKQDVIDLPEGEENGKGWNPLNAIAGLVPVKSVIGKQMDGLTQMGVAHIFIVLFLLVLIVCLIGWFVRSYVRNRRGYRNRIRRVSNGYYKIVQESENGRRRHAQGVSWWTSLPLLSWIFRGPKSVKGNSTRKNKKKY